jgi:hypothetical protein
VFSLKRGELCASKLLVNLQQTTRRHMPKDSAIRHSKRRKNLKYRVNEDTNYRDNVTFNGFKC